MAADHGEIEQDICGYSYDHDTEVTYDGPDGCQWVCRRCGAEGWEEPYPDAEGSDALSGRSEVKEPAQTFTLPVPNASPLSGGEAEDSDRPAGDH